MGMIANEEASAFTDSKVNSEELVKSNGFESSESINKDVSNETSNISKEETPLKKLDVAENVSKNGEIMPKEKNEDIIKNGDDESLAKNSVETEKEPPENSVEKTEKETPSTNESKEENDNKEIQNKKSETQI